MRLIILAALFCSVRAQVSFAPEDEEKKSSVITDDLHSEAFAASCGGISEKPGTVTSPNYPDYYPAGSRCVWTFKAPQSKRIKVYFPFFDLYRRFGTRETNPCLWDYLEVKGEEARGKRYCEHDLESKEITINGNKLVLLFQANYGLNRGFKAQVTFV